MDDARARFARNLREARANARLTQEALAEVSGLHPTEISRLEGALRDPRLGTLVRLARALEIPPAQLLAGIA
jgi:transcriptional regulator with XRE-family HTH domain